MEIRKLACDPSNYKRAARTEVEYIVVHYTGNKGDTAENNAKYFANNGDLAASAHYFVDEDEIWQSVTDRNVAWHCGAASYRHPACRNANSIGVEVCMWDSEGGLRPGSIDHAAALVRELMARYGVTADRVLRHYDVTGKKCPAPMVNDPSLWADFKQQLSKEEETVRYHRLTDVPADYGFRTAIGKLMTAGIIAGDGSDPEGNGDVIDLSHDMVRLLMFHYRAGVFDAALKNAGLDPAV